MEENGSFSFVLVLLSPWWSLLSLLIGSELSDGPSKPFTLDLSSVDLSDEDKSALFSLSRDFGLSSVSLSC